MSARVTSVDISTNPLMHRPVVDPSVNTMLSKIELPAARFKHQRVRAPRRELVPYDPRITPGMLETVVVPSCDQPLPHVNPALPIDVLVVSVGSDPSWKERARVKYVRTYNTQHLVQRKGFVRVKQSVLIVNRAPAGLEFVSMFITSATDARLNSVMAPAVCKVYDAVSSHIKMKDPTRWAAQRDGKDGDNDHNTGYLGKLYNEGLQFYKQNLTDRYGYFTAHAGAKFDKAYAASVGTFGRLHDQFEASHLPCMHRARHAAAKKFRTLSLLPGLSTRLVPGHTMGTSVGFANDIHNDSSSAGFTESIHYTRTRPFSAPWGFCIWRPRVIFDLASEPACAVYVPGREPHGSLPTGFPHVVHPGRAAVIFQRTNVDAIRWLRLVKKYGAGLARAFSINRGRKLP